MKLKYKREEPNKFQIKNTKIFSYYKKYFSYYEK